MIISAKCLTKRQKRVLMGMLRKFEQQTLGKNSRNRLDCIDCYIINGKPVAFIFYIKEHMINALFVNKKYRNRGIGNKLRQYAIAQFSIPIVTFAKEKYKSYYESLGFTMSETGRATSTPYSLSPKTSKKYELKIFTKQPN